MKILQGFTYIYLIDFKFSAKHAGCHFSLISDVTPSIPIYLFSLTASKQYHFWNSVIMQLNCIKTIILFLEFHHNVIQVQEPMIYQTRGKHANHMPPMWLITSEDQFSMHTNTREPKRICVLPENYILFQIFFFKLIHIMDTHNCVRRAWVAQRVR